MASFEVFKSGFPRSPGAPRIGLSRRGYFSVNGAACEMLGRPSRVLLLYDEERALVGLQPAEQDTPYSYRLVKQGKSASYIIAGKAFCDYHNIRYRDGVRQFVPREEDDLVVFEVGEQEG